MCLVPCTLLAHTSVSLEVGLSIETTTVEIMHYFYSIKKFRQEIKEM